MSKEIKIGVAAIGSLLVIFGVVVFGKVWGGKPVPPASVDGGKKDPADGESQSHSKTSAPAPTVIPASGGTNGEGFPARTGWIGSEGAHTDGKNDPGFQHPRHSFLPKDKSEFDRDPAPTKPSGEDRFEPFGNGSRFERARPIDAESRLVPTPDARRRPRPEVTGIGAPTTGAPNALRAPRRQDPTDGTASHAQYSTSRHGTPSTAPTRPAPTNPTPTWQRYPADEPARTVEVVQQNRPETFAGHRPSTPSPYRTDSPTAQVLRAGPTSDDSKHTVRPNDSFYLISKAVYGTGDFFKALVEHNRKRFADSNELRVGDVVSTPSVAYLRKNYPVFCPKDRKRPNTYYRTTALNTARSQGKRIYEVQEGDTLFTIASQQLGRVSKAWQVYQLNQDLIGDDFDYLKPGWKLVMPSVDPQPTDTLTRQPGRILNR